MSMYLADGTLASDRVVRCSENKLTFDKALEFKVTDKDGNTTFAHSDTEPSAEEFKGVQVINASNGSEVFMATSDGETGIDIYNFDDTQNIDIYINGPGDVDNSLIAVRLGRVVVFAKSTIISNAFSTPGMAVHTAGGNVTIPDSVRGLYYDPASAETSAEITTPENPVDGQEIPIIFGGTITSGTVIIALTILPNTGQSIVGTPPTTATVDTRFTLKYRELTTQWNIIVGN